MTKLSLLALFLSIEQKKEEKSVNMHLEPRLEFQDACYCIEPEMMTLEFETKIPACPSFVPSIGRKAGECSQPPFLILGLEECMAKSINLFVTLRTGR